MKLGIYYTLGDRTLEESVALLKGAANAGADLLEVGLPFSDPLLDGPVIQASHIRASKNEGGPSWKELCSALVELKKSTGKQVSVMSSIQLLLPEERHQSLPEMDGLLLTDVSFRQASPFKCSTPRVWFLSQDIAQQGKLELPQGDVSMVYLTRVQGITGADQQAESTIEGAIKNLKQQIDVPIWVGFGISKREDIEKDVKHGAVGGIVGSAFVKAVDSFRVENPKATLQDHENFGANWVKQFLGK